MLYRFDFRRQCWDAVDHTVNFCIWPPLVDIEDRARLPDPNGFKKRIYQLPIFERLSFEQDPQPDKISYQVKQFRTWEWAYQYRMCGFYGVRSRDWVKYE